MPCCDHCKREFIYLDDYPLIEIRSFEYLPLRERVGSAYLRGGHFDRHVSQDIHHNNGPAPQEIIDALAPLDKGTIVREGIIWEKPFPSHELPNGKKGELYTYFTSRHDMTDAARATYEAPVTRQFLAELEHRVGSVRSPFEILDLQSLEKYSDKEVDGVQFGIIYSEELPHDTLFSGNREGEQAYLSRWSRRLGYLQRGFGTKYTKDGAETDPVLHNNCHEFRDKDDLYDQGRLYVVIHGRQLRPSSNESRELGERPAYFGFRIAKLEFEGVLAPPEQTLEILKSSDKAA